MAQEKIKSPKVRVRFFFSILILIAGAGAMMGLKAMKVPPREAVRPEKIMRVKTLMAQPRNVAVLIQGFGEVRCLNTLDIAPEVSGKIVSVHPRLEVGEIVEKGDLLFTVDPVNYQSALDQARATVKKQEQTISRLTTELKLEKKRLATLERNRDLAGTEFQRVASLFRNDRVGTRSSVDRAEQTYNTTRDLVDQMTRMLAIYPIQIQENKSALAGARAALSTALANVKRCRVTAPFKGRLKSVSVEQGAHATPGVTLLTLADDSLLEIHVPLDSRDVNDWLEFDTKDTALDQAWFSGIRPVDVEIHWTENPRGAAWVGHLHRTVAFDPASRTVTVAVRIPARNAMAGKNLPLVEGMFCRVAIPGKQLHNVVALPRWAVTFENTVYAVKNGRLKTLPVSVARTQGEETYVSHGISPGQEIIITRLVAPLENTLLDIVSSREGS
ncbi:RND family efflux transporter, MFP subunit [Desulfocicer vacuolatum DSM 3385]|uniref:RND family efflux transporter, MFP subunit n=1 Tax=Desulfocicer vacuolatum DSM 3385 TaxID=1121400 RepID=A0A1W2A6M8_9BACT|nr:efflux RND transporter periplasmic adaptor subunit [Desulfocicer vacuolatum]SMC56233.1 RND family efflux transporter, MFP subunit [Desulfocicer vacuolatum DSM 3385]